MASPPSSALAAASVTAAALARLVGDLAGAVPLPAATALSVTTACRRIRVVEAPRILAAADVGAIGSALVSAVRTLARAADPADAAAQLYDAAGAAGATYPVSASPVLTRSYAVAAALAAGVEVACLGEAFLAEARTGFANSAAAGDARGRIAAAMDAAGDRIADRLGQEVLAVLSTAARQTTAFLVAEATTLQPLVRIDAARSFPAGALAWALYGDPSRAGELAARNRCGTSLFMPPTIEAIAPKT